MINIAKNFSNLRIQNILEYPAKLNLNFLSTRSASEAEIKETTEFYDTIATKYHRLLDLHTWGLHRIWRRALANSIEIRQGTKILDAPAGTGLNTLKILEKLKHFRSEPDFRITMFDMNPHMMRIGRDIFKRVGYAEKFINYVEGDLHKLPFDAESFDIVISSLANRPYVDYSAVLKEINRVLKSKGKIIILDYCFSQNPTTMQRLFCNYIEFIASKIEKIFFGNIEAAEFVTKSIRDVVGKTDVQQMLINAEFHKIVVKQLSFGMAVLTVAVKK